jgi:hypothetical protein
MKANFAAKVAFVTPFVTAIVALVTGLGAHAGVFGCVTSILGGFAIGIVFGALSGGFANILLSTADQCTSQFYIVGIAVGYVLLPIVFLAMACMTVLHVLRLLL